MQSCASARSSSRSCKCVLVERVLDDLGKPRAHLRLLAVANGFDQQLAQRPAFELKLAEHVEHLAAERLARLLQLLQQPAIDVAFAGLLRDQVPEVADFGLADAVDAPEALLQPVRVPRQVVIHHQVRALKVDAFASRVGRQQHLDFGIVPEGFLRLHPLLAAHAAMDDDDGLAAAEQRRDAPLQVVERVAVLGEDDELLVRRGCRLRRRRTPASYGAGSSAKPLGDRGRREDLAEQGRQLAPFLVLAAAPDRVARPSRRFSVSISMRSSSIDARRRGLVENLLLGRFDLGVGRVFQVLDIFLVEDGHLRR